MRILSFLVLASTASAFVTPSASSLRGVVASTSGGSSPRLATPRVLASLHGNNDNDDEDHLMADHKQQQQQQPTKSLPAGLVQTAATTATVWAATTQMAAAAAGPDWGIFEGRTGSLIHPVVMGSLLLYSLYTGILGLQWRRQRTLGAEINAKQKLVQPVAEDETPSASQVALQAEISDLQKERKDLAAGSPRDRHFSQGALLAFLGTAFAIEGPLNTYARAGKLFPGPHLYVGAGLVCVWALAVATVPSMQKGSETARTIHIGANVAGLALFAWQVTTGLPILFKVIELTKWP